MFAPVGSVFAQDPGTVDMQGVQFVPQEIHVSPGATVLWTNGSPLAHTVTADDGTFDSGSLNTGDTFTVVFDAPGTYAYSCVPHKSLGMVGTVVVDDPGAVADPAAEAPAEAAAAPAPTRNPNPAEYYPDH
jgi:plastocyanin